MKRLLSLLLAVLLLPGLIPQALAADPDPIPVLTEDEIPPTPYGIHHYMLICIDSWDAKLKDQWVSATGQWGYHTDGLILVTVDEGMGRVMLTSFIRDMLIQRPDGKYGRINNFLDKDGWAYAQQKNEYEGLRALVDTINSHFGLRIDKFIVVDFKQVENIIDAVGGVDITITNREATYLKNYSISRSSTTPEISSGGTYHFSGHAAVIYMRIRKVQTAEYLHDDGRVYADTQDYGRTYRDRVVLSSIADSLKTITYADATKLLNVIIANTVYTNMTQDDLFDALDLAMDLKGIPAEHIRMPIEGTYEEFPYAGMATKQIDFEANRDALHDFLFQSFIVVEDE